MSPLLALLLALATGGTEDAAHRADRVRTEALNRAAGRASGDRERATAARQAAAARAYEERLEAWRRGVEACRAGRYDACRPD